MAHHGGMSPLRSGRAASAGAVLLTAVLVLGACDAESPHDEQPKGTSSSSSSSTSGSSASAGPGLPPGSGVSSPAADALIPTRADRLPGVVQQQALVNDPRQPVSLRYPQVPGFSTLSSALSSWATRRVTTFRGDNAPSASAPPELNGGWSVEAASGRTVGIRLDVYEFAGASGSTETRTVWTDGPSRDVGSGRDLVQPVRRGALVRQLVSLLRASGHTVTDEPDADLAAQALDGASFTADGRLLVHLSEGLLTSSSDGTLDVTLPGDPSSDLTALGRAARNARSSGAPSFSSSSPSPSASSSSSAPSPSASSSRGAVDCATARCVALTFDDGPGPYTDQLLDHLETAKVPATFFVLGQNANARPDVLRRMRRAGHEIGDHTWDHRSMPQLSPGQQGSEVSRTRDEITRIAGGSVRLLRPPYGAMNDTTRSVARQQGMALVLWDVDTLDWKNRDVGQTTARAMAGARRGSIVLMHDIHPSTVRAVPGIIARLRAKGFTLVTVSQLVGSTTPGTTYSRAR